LTCYAAGVGVNRKTLQPFSHQKSKLGSLLCDVQMHGIVVYTGNHQ